MSESLLSRIQKLYGEFSKGQRLIASYIKGHYEEAAFMTAAKIAKTVNVSESTVVRFATELGYEGYPELQKAMQEMIKSKLTSVQRIEVAINRIGKDHILKNVLNQDIRNIQKTLYETSNEDFYKAVDFILKSRRKYIFATRGSKALGSFLFYYLDLIFDDVRQVNATSETEIYEKMLRINSDDCVIGISFPRYSKHAVKAMQFAADRGAKVIALTDSKESPLVKYSDCVLLARSDMVSIVDSLVAPMSLINALIAATAIRKKEDVSHTFRELEEIWDKYQVYEKIK